MHPKNNQHRESIQGEQLSAFTFYQDLLHLIYRFSLLMVSEERGLITKAPPIIAITASIDCVVWQKSIRPIPIILTYAWNRDHF
jgi:hypothetical protein